MFNWHRYNESLVKRGEILLDFDVIDNWYSELNIMNKHKEGAAYRYPNSFVQLLGYMRVYFFVYNVDKLKKMLSGLMLVIKYHPYQTTVQ